MQWVHLTCSFIRLDLKRFCVSLNVCNSSCVGGLKRFWQPPDLTFLSLLSFTASHTTSPTCPSLSSLSYTSTPPLTPSSACTSSSSFSERSKSSSPSSMRLSVSLTATLLLPWRELFFSFYVGTTTNRILSTHKTNFTFE